MRKRPRSFLERGRCRAILVFQTSTKAHDPRAVKREVVAPKIISFKCHAVGLLCLSRRKLCVVYHRFRPLSMTNWSRHKSPHSRHTYSTIHHAFYIVPHKAPSAVFLSSIPNRFTRDYRQVSDFILTVISFSACVPLFSVVSCCHATENMYFKASTRPHSHHTRHEGKQ